MKKQSKAILGQVRHPSLTDDSLSGLSLHFYLGMSMSSLSQKLE